ncbi:MAG: hypothetical protein ABR576_11535 [Thermoanaerobaculia bacterium]
MKHARRALLPLAVLTVFLAASACSDFDGPTEPRGPFAQRVTLRAGQTTRIEPEGVEIGFFQITVDSRCPITAICIQAGEARGTFGIARSRVNSGLFPFELSTLHPNRAEVEGYRVTLESIAPSPTGQPIPPGDYVAELLIERDERPRGSSPTS